MPGAATFTDSRLSSPGCTRSFARQIPTFVRVSMAATMGNNYAAFVPTVGWNPISRGARPFQSQEWLSYRDENVLTQLRLGEVNIFHNSKTYRAF